MAQSILSPDTDTFSTPPTTPGPQALANVIRPSLSRKSSRPSSLLLENSQAEWKPDIVIVETSPGIAKKMSNGLSPAAHDQSVITPKSSAHPHHAAPRLNPHHNKPMAMDSPCFVHSYLDKGADWVRSKHNVEADVGVSRSLQRSNSSYSESFSPPGSANSSVIESNDEDEEGAGNLTTKLAETAVGVREMSKQLG